MLVGLVQGVILLTTDYCAGIVFHPDLVPGIILLVHVVLNRGRQLCGLAATFDAIAAKKQGAQDAETQTRPLRLSHSVTGPAGVTAIVFALGLKYLSLLNLTHFLPFTYYSSLILLPVIPKWTIVISMFYGKPAVQDGMERSFLHRKGVKKTAISTLILVLLFILPGLLVRDSMPGNQYIFFAALLITLYGLCRVLAHYFHAHLGGHRGDTLGATGEIAELSFLFMVIIWSRLSI